VVGQPAALPGVADVRVHRVLCRLSGTGLDRREDCLVLPQGLLVEGRWRRAVIARAVPRALEQGPGDALGQAVAGDLHDDVVEAHVGLAERLGVVQRRTHGLEGLPENVARTARRRVDAHESRGDRFEEADFEAAAVALEGVLTDNGYAYAKVRRAADVDLVQQVASLGYWVDAGPQARLGEIHVSGLGGIPESQVRRTLDLHAGEPYSRSELESAERALLDLGVFSAVSVQPQLQPLVSNEPPRDKQVTLVVLNDGEPLAKLPDWAAQFVSNQEPYAILAPRGVGPTAWTKQRANYVERAHLLVGRTVDQGRVWDVAAVARPLNGEGPVRVIGRGQAGILAAYAALWEPSIREVVLVDPPTSHATGPIFMNVLRVLDVPEALGLLAPRPLTLVNAGDAAFDRTQKIYERAGAERSLQRR